MGNYCLIFRLAAVAFGAKFLDTVPKTMGENRPATSNGRQKAAIEPKYGGNMRSFQRNHDCRCALRGCAKAGGGAAKACSIKQNT